MFHLLHDKVHRAVSKPILARDDLTSPGTSSGKNFAGKSVNVKGRGEDSPAPLPPDPSSPWHPQDGGLWNGGGTNGCKGRMHCSAVSDDTFDKDRQGREGGHTQAPVPGLTAHARALTSCAHSWHARAEMCGGQQHYFLWLIQGQGLRYWVIFKLLPSFLPNFIDLRRNTLPSSLPLSLHTRKCLRPEEYNADLCNPRRS